MHEINEVFEANGKKYRVAPEIDKWCTGCAGMSRHSLCELLPECGSQKIIFVDIEREYEFVGNYKHKFCYKRILDGQLFEIYGDTYCYNFKPYLTEEDMDSFRNSRALTVEKRDKEY